jgi:hypothetical protein
MQNIAYLAPKPGSDIYVWVTDDNLPGLAKVTQVVMSGSDGRPVPFIRTDVAPNRLFNWHELVRRRAELVARCGTLRALAA